MRLVKTWEQACDEIRQAGGNPHDVNEDRDLADLWMIHCEGQIRPAGTTDDEYQVMTYLEHRLGHDCDEPDLIIEHDWT